MKEEERDAVLWAYLGGKPVDAELDRRLQEDPGLANRLADLAMLEMDLHELAARKGKRASVGPSFRWRIAVGTSGVAAALVLGFWMLQPESGTPRVLGGDRGVTKALAAGGPIVVGEEGLSLGFVDERTQLESDAGSALEVRVSEQGGKRVVLSAGTLNASVDPQEEAFRVETPQMDLVVLGTRFQVEADPRTGTWAGVEEGRVQALPRGGSARELTVGQGWWQMPSGRGVNAAYLWQIEEGSVQVDGVVDDVWARHPRHQMTFDTKKATHTVSSARDHSSFWQAAWSEEALYVRIEVTDDMPGHGNEFPWANDSAEIFIDADGARGVEMDGRNDYLLFFDPTMDEIYPGIGSLKPQPGMSHVTRRTANGFRIETRMTWSALGVGRRTEGDRMGFNICSNDADVIPGKRRSQWTWTPKVQGDFGKPDRMGVITLREGDPP